MEYRFDLQKAEGYKSKSQIMRVLTESWVGSNLFCLRCGNSQIEHFNNNKAVADFFCPNCHNEYELKSKKGVIGSKINDGAYDTFIQRITSNNNPDFLILNYSETDLCVENLWFIPKHFFVPDIVEKRKPLSNNARRAGWVGCNILFDAIPIQGRIKIIQNRKTIDKEIVISQIERISHLETKNIDARGWMLDVLNCVNQIPSTTFTLNDIYSFDKKLGEKHPQNNNIRPKIRQQLQLLRDKGIIKFAKRGLYQKI